MPRLSVGLEQVFTNLGIVGDGYKLFFFDTGTMIPKTTYSDEDLTVQNTNPVVLNEAGRPDVSIWGMDPSLYRMILGTPDSVLGNITVVVDVDPVDNYNVNNIAGLTPIPTAYWGTTAGTSINYTLNPALVDITSYSNQQTFLLDFHIACGASPDIDINGLGALDLKKYTISGTKVALQAGDVQPQRHLCINDGVDIVVLNPTAPYLNLKNASVTGPTTQVFTSGTAATYTTPTGAKSLKIVMVGGGGGGGGSTGTGGTGGTTSFNSITAIGGTGGVCSTDADGGVGGTAGSGTANLRISGQQGGAVQVNAGYTFVGAGGSTAFFGGGAPNTRTPAGTVNGTNGTTNTGGGGGGGCITGNVAKGSGGGAAEYVEFFINSPSATYSYTIGAGGAAGTGTATGGVGAAGRIIVYEYYV